MLSGGLSTVTTMQIALVASIGVGVMGAILAWPKRTEPGGSPLVVLLAGQCWWSASLFFQLNATSRLAKVFWIEVSWLGVVVIPVAWLFFALEYTGHDQYVTWRNVGIVSVIPAVTAFLSLTNQFHDLLYISATMVETESGAVMEPSPGVWFWVIAGYTYLLGVLGAVPLIQFITSDVSLFRGQSVALLAGLVVPWATNILHLLEVFPTGGIDPTPVAFCVTGIAYLGAMTRFQLFGTTPAPIRPAKRSLFQRMEEAAIIVDRHEQVVELNDRAIAILEGERAEVVGEPFAEAFPAVEAAMETTDERGPALFRTDDPARSYDIGVSGLTDATGRPIGRVITLHDITPYVRQQQRLRVLNRMFRHNVRIIVQLLIGQAERVAETDAEAAAAIKDYADEIEAISEGVRTALSIFDTAHRAPQPTALEPTLQDCLRTVEAAFPDVEIDPPSNIPDVQVDSLLVIVLEELIENAAEHNTAAEPSVWIDVTQTERRVRVTIADNGPGIDESELMLLEQGMETPLEHGSGLGLALAIWGVQFAEGDISFEAREPTGLRITVELPVIAGAEGERDSDGGLVDVAP